MWKFISTELVALQFSEIGGMMLLFLAGFLALRLFLGNNKLWFSLAMAIPTGFAISSFVMTLFAYLNIKFSVSSMAVMMILLILVFGFFQYKYWLEKLKNFKFNKLKFIFKRNSLFSLSHALMILAIITILIIMFLKSIYWQPISWDVITSFDLNGKAIASEGTFLHSLLAEENEVGLGVAYTPLVSGSFAYLYMFGYEFSKVFAPIILISFAIIFYHILREISTKHWAAFVTLLCFLTPEFVSHGAINQTNLALALFVFASTIPLYFWYTNDFKRSYLYLAFFMALLASWVRSEGFIAIIIVFLISFLISWKAKKNKLVPAIAAFVSFLPFISWQIYQKAYGEYFAKFTQATISLSDLTFWDKEKYDVLYSYTKAHITSVQLFGVTFHLLWVFIVLLLLYHIYKYVKTKKITLDVSHISLFIFFFLWISYLVLLYEMSFLSEKSSQINQLKAVSGSSYKRYIFNFVPFIWFFIATNAMSLKFSKWLNKFLYGSKLK